MMTPRTLTRSWCILGVALLPGLALAQAKYSMNPVRFRATVRPGATIKSGFTLTNNGDRPMTIKVWARESTQDEEGHTRLLPEDQEPVRPCAPWVTFETPQAVVEPRQGVEFKFECRVPADASGFYAMGLVSDPEATPAPGGGPFGVNVVVRMVASFRIEVTGRAAKEALEVPQAAIEQVEDKEAATTWTAAKVAVRNTGETLLEPSVELEVSRKTADRWLLVWRGKGDPDDLFPGAQRVFTVSTGRSWPSGEYKLKARGVNNGRTLATAEFETPFTSPLPTTGELFGEVAANVEPALIDFQIVPNAARSRVVTLLNDEGVPLKVRFEPTEPRQLAEARKTKAEGQPSASCAGWLSTLPTELEVPPAKSANIRVLATAPEGASGSYYANLVLHCDSADGSIHGARQALVWVHTPGDVRYGGRLGAIVMAQGDGNQFVLTMPFWNIGNVHVKPKGKLTIASGTPLECVLGCAEELVLPEAESALSALLDAGRLQTGEYDLKAVVEVGSGATTVERVGKLKVVWTEGKPTLTLDQDVRATQSAPPAEKAGKP
ncbi:MAG: hypothetical protein FJX75_21725 [Armatimonadetes bacterium]|nr:hypothetical protein [Armatimonadota bacterium]